jgi:hypothetical protein
MRMPTKGSGAKVYGFPQMGTSSSTGAANDIMAVPKTPSSLINEWAEHIAAALLDQQAWFRHALTHAEIQTLTGLNGLQVSRGCWHGRLHGLLNFEQRTGQVRYTLTPLGVAIARRLKSGRSDMLVPGT